MANFSAPLLNAPIGTAFRTTGFLFTPTASFRRAMLYEVEMGQTAAYASTDAPMQWDLSRASNTAGIVGTTVAGNLLDPGDIASITLFMQNLTTEPTNYTTAGNGLNLKQWGINQRGSYRWRALDDGDNIIIAAVASQGIGIRAASIASGFAGSALGTLAYIER
jgi:hypothetical protein